MKWLERNCAYIWLFTALSCLGALVPAVANRWIVYLIVVTTFFVGSYDNHIRRIHSGNKEVDCAYCGTRITKRIINGAEEVWSDSTGNWTCPQRAEDLVHTPVLVEPSS
jgi:hypothetical protein